jgi:peroxiredoxin
MKARALIAFVILIAAASAAAWAIPAQAPRPRPGVVGDSDTPRILAFDVTPKTLKNNRINFVQLYFKFYDETANLKGGILNINFLYESASGAPLFPHPSEPGGTPDPSEAPPGAIAPPVGGRPTFITYPLTESVFGKKTGEFRLWFGLLAEDFTKVSIGIWLRDSAGNNGLESAWIPLVRSTASSGPKQGRQVGQLAYDFTLLDKAGNRKTLSAYRGKVVLIDLCTMWCKYCKAEAAELQQLYLKYRQQGFVILNVLTENYAGSPIRPSDCKTWAEAYGLTFPVLADLFWGVFDPYYAFPSTRRIPDNILIDKTGKIRWKKLGYTAAIKAQMETKIQQLLAE